jgi:hypothetical protein
MKSSDHATVENASHAEQETPELPSDAGVHAGGLSRVLSRIPQRWGRGIRCGAGWYALVVELDGQISALIGDYEIQQVKQKYGTLRFYWDFIDLVPGCCTELDAADPRPVAGSLYDLGSQTRQYALLKQWCQRREAHCETEEHLLAEEALERQLELRGALVPEVEALIERAEQASAQMCEVCAAPGQLISHHGWVMVRCPECVQSPG